jgi:hypothetical protein
MKALKDFVSGFLKCSFYFSIERARRQNVTVFQEKIIFTKFLIINLLRRKRLQKGYENVTLSTHQIRCVVSKGIAYAMGSNPFRARQFYKANAEKSSPSHTLILHD